MQQRQRTILIIAAVLIVVGILAFVLRSRTGSSQQAPAIPTREAPAASGAMAPAVSSAGAVAAPAPVPASSELAVRQLATTFTERYGSYSTEGHFVNITDLTPIVTERYARELEQLVVRQRAANVTTGFRSTTTVAIGVTSALAGGEAATHGTVTVATRRTEVVAGAAPRTYAQPITVELLKTSAGWRVDRATWGAAAK